MTQPRAEAKAKSALLSYWLAKRGPVPSAIVSELSLHKWQYRADLAIVRGEQTIGIEIKTDRDRLDRLGGQLTAYASVFDFVYAAVATKHLVKARKLLPAGVGLIEIIETESGVSIKQRRAARPCKRQNKSSLLKLLPVSALRRLAVIARGKPRNRAALERAAMKLPLAKIKPAVRAFMAERYAKSTKSFLTASSSEANDASRLALLRVWAKRAHRPAVYTRPVEQDLFLLSLMSRLNEKPFGEVPADIAERVTH